jgi:hypothetical protein
MIVRPNAEGKYSKQAVYDWFIGLGPRGPKSYCQSVSELDAKLHRRLTSKLGASFSSVELFCFLQPHRSRCKSCGHSLNIEGKDYNSFTLRKGFRGRYCSRACSASAPEVRRKVEATHLRRRGVPHVSMDKTVVDKRRQTNVERYGAPGVFGSCLEEQAKNTIKDRYGVEFFSQSGEWKRKVSATCMKRRGVAWVTQDPEVFERAHRSSYKRKSIRIKGKLHIVQGFEGAALKFLEPCIKKLKTRPGELPKLMYTFDGRTSRYYPDALIRTVDGDKLLLEVKSVYTAQRDGAKNFKKFRAAIRWCEENDAKFLLAIVHVDGRVDTHYISSLSKAKRLLAI